MNNNRKMKTMDGNCAAAYASYAFTEIAAIYPITPSSVMAEITDKWSSCGKKNIFDENVQVNEMQSEAGAAGAVHGALSAGVLATTYTSSQGLLLMIPNLYKIAGERLPGVFNVAARAIATHALSIFGDHSDIYACRQTGCAMLCESSVQEIMDLTPVSHMSSIESKTPFINFFDGFRTSHEIQKIEVWDYNDLKNIIDVKFINKFRKHALNPNNPCQRGSAQNPDIYFQIREACNIYYNALPLIVQKYMNKINNKIGTNYKLFNYYGSKKPEHIIISMGSINGTIEETIDYLLTLNKKVGSINVHLYRPFCSDALIKIIPKTVKQITVLDRTKEPGSIGEPLYLDVVTALKNSEFSSIPIYSGRYGLGSKDTTPSQIFSVFNNKIKKRFTIGIIDDITNLSLKINKHITTTTKNTINCKFWGLGSDGTVGANKNSIKIIGDNTNMYVQAYFDYDSKKSGGITVSHLRFGNKPIKSSYLIKKANFIACHNSSYIKKYDIVQELVDGGTFLLNCSWDKDELDKYLPKKVKIFIANHSIKFYIIDGVKIGIKIGIGPTRINTILQSAFFKLSNIIEEKQAINLMKIAAKNTYGYKGNDIVLKNYAAIDNGAKQIIKINIPDYWKTIKDNNINTNNVVIKRKDVRDFVNNIQSKVLMQKGNNLPVSTFMNYVDGTTPSGTSAYEKRGIAVNVPIWNSKNCIQCNRCSYVCPHSSIRPVILTKDEEIKAPITYKLPNVIGFKQYKFAIVISILDCTGCGSCVNVCPGKKNKKAIIMNNIKNHNVNQKFFDYAIMLPEKNEIFKKFNEITVKGSQFKKPLLEFSGACAGCGETPYAKLITQLFGDKMYIANATGCSSIWGNSSPSTPYTINSNGKGPAWNNSLFEDNAEFGYGMFLAQDFMRVNLKNKINFLINNNNVSKKEKLAYTNWINTYNCSISNTIATKKLISILKNSNNNNIYKDIIDNKNFLSKKSQWIFGGDGWAYDIGFSGLDHVLASGKDINVFVFDTEVYSNTGGQSSKATPIGAIAQFASNGKNTKKKDLASMAISYGYVYVAQISMGSDFKQTIKAIVEAESYFGPSLIIAYSPCINHGIKKGMDKVQIEEELAVKLGYWHNFRFNPQLSNNKFILDSKKPSGNYEDFLNGEVRYNSLKRLNPEKAKKFFKLNKEYAKKRYEYLKKLVVLYKN